MAVLLPNRRLGVQRHNPLVSDSHGDRYETGWAALAGPWPGWARQSDDLPRGDIGGGTFVLLMDPQAWPVSQGDLVVDPDAALAWLVTAARLITNSVAVDVDYVRVEAHQRDPGGTRP